MADEKVPQRYGVFDPQGAALAFYSDDVYDGSHQRTTIPPEAVEITEQVWREMINNQPGARYINGAVTIIKPLGTQSSDWGPTMSDVLH